MSTGEESCSVGDRDSPSRSPHAELALVPSNKDAPPVESKGDPGGPQLCICAPSQGGSVFLVWQS